MAWQLALDTKHTLAPHQDNKEKPAHQLLIVGRRGEGRQRWRRGRVPDVGLGRADDAAHEGVLKMEEGWYTRVFMARRCIAWAHGHPGS